MFHRVSSTSVSSPIDNNAKLLLLFHSCTQPLVKKEISLCLFLMKSREEEWIFLFLSDFFREKMMYVVLYGVSIIVVLLKL